MNLQQLILAAALALVALEVLLISGIWLGHRQAKRRESRIADGEEQ